MPAHIRQARVRTNMRKSPPMELEARLGTQHREAKVVGLICAGHFFSHFYLLLVPPLFPLLRDVYGVGFTELGFAVAAYSITGGIAQIPLGFLVDRYGSRTILIAGIMLESVAIALIGVFPYYGALVALMVAAGLANAVFHPADYAILNASVHKSRIGRVFSFHTFTGYLGDAVAPVTILFLASLLDWRVAMFVCGVCGALTGALIWMNAGILTDAAGEPPAAPAHGDSRRTGMALLFSVPVLMGLLFFAGVSFTGRGFSHFGVATLHELYQTPLGTAGAVLSAYLFASPLGVLAGGYAADRMSRHDLVSAACFVVIAACVFAIALFNPPLLVIGMLFALAGFCNGFLAPPRDLLIRALTPPQEMGKVFGFVTAGFSLGGMVAPIVYGWLLDHSDPGNLFWVIGAAALVTVTTVLITGREGRRAQRQ